MAERRVVDLPALIRERAGWRAAGRVVVMTNGCFDLLHAGHIQLLEAARREGDILIVAVNSDRSVHEIKGPERPLIPEAERAETLAAFECVDRVVVFDEPTPAELVAAVVPDVLVKGADWDQGAIVGSDTVEAAGGRVVRVALTGDLSTTAIVERIRRT
jgi:rfaE bifunctional protein nucleotidyltransferase chain/domain